MPVLYLAVKYRLLVGAEPGSVLVEKNVPLKKWSFFPNWDLELDHGYTVDGSEIWLTT